MDGLREAPADSDPEGRLAPIGMKRSEIGPGPSPLDVAGTISGPSPAGWRM